MSWYVLIDSSSAIYPADGIGASTTAFTGSLVDGAAASVLSHFLVNAQHTSATTLTVYKENGTTSVYVVNIPASTTENFVGKTIKLEFPVLEGFSAAVSNSSTTGRLHFDFE